MKMRIGVTSGWEPGMVVKGWPLIYTVKPVIEKIEKLGGIPIIIPVLENTDYLADYMEFLDGIIVSGEVMSIKQNVIKEGSKNILETSNPLRYKNEAVIIRQALAQNVPLLGICRGYQVLVVIEGGTVTDEDININNSIIHQQGELASPDKTVHSVTMTPGSHLQNLLGVDTIMVNSFHRQGVKSAPEGYRISAVSPDGNIEAIEKKGKTFVLGVQFHPEMLGGDIWEQFFVRLFEHLKQK
ncbi:glutamine amidotransferase class-I domain protein [Candidatus Vecturithrix granuli]|uniref:Glutamine amidotransferase class-I domain protein n=1 Tax=Vecturithrix granuli TaxID=1499967 RepID=A0A081C7N2_VECG1|nr:glutamine amidotransferase class-I domain protein [Candidatus Vecturithrix granuli]